jgi:hypothetical protein
VFFLIWGSLGFEPVAGRSDKRPFGATGFL